MAAGSAAAFQATAPVLTDCAQTVFELGTEAGPGSEMKAVNQLLAGVHVVAMAEAMALGMTQSIDPVTFVEVITKCADTSWILQNRAPHIVTADDSLRNMINIWPKDLGIVLDVAKSAEFSAPISAAALQKYRVAVGMGLGAKDDAAIAKVYARNVCLTFQDAADN